jgi:microcystin-dependent protein
LVGEGEYAKDATLSFPLGYVDIYTIEGKTQLGEVVHTLTEPEMPNHTHTISLKTSAGGSSTNGLEPTNGYTNSKELMVSTKPAGGDQAHNNMPPFHVVQWYIKVK